MEANNKMAIIGVHMAAAAEAAGAGVGGPKRVFARTTCDRHRIV